MGRPLKSGPFHGEGGWKTVSPGYFEVFRIHVVRGRSFTECDNHAGPPEVIINESMARRFWPKGDPLQDRILIGKGVMPQLDAEQPRQIIGIVADQRDRSLNQDPEPEMYIPNGQATDAIQALNVKLTPLAWVIKTRIEPMKLRAAVEERLNPKGLCMMARAIKAPIAPDQHNPSVACDTEIWWDRLASRARKAFRVAS